MMKQLYQLLAFVLLASSASLSSVQAADWPAFGGPDADFTVDEPELASWAEQGPQELWRLNVGEGFGGAAIYEGKAYIFDRADGKDYIRCVELATGSEVWRFERSAPGRVGYPGSRAVPTVTDEYVYAIGPMGAVYCVTRASGDLVWHLNMEQDLGGNVPRFGYADHPLLYDGKIILTPVGQAKSVTAVSADTGEEIWSVGGIPGNIHSTPAIETLFGKDYVVFNGGSNDGGNLVGIDPSTGEVAFRYEGYPIFLPIPAPIAIGDNKLFIPGGYGAGIQMLEAKEADGRIILGKIWDKSYNGRIHRPLIHDDHIFYILNDDKGGRSRWGRSSNGKNLGLTCMDMDGNIAWNTGDDPNFWYGGFLLVADHFIVQDGENGVIRLVEASTEGYKELGKYDAFGMDDGTDHQAWGPLAISGDTLLIRSQREMVALKLPLAN